MERKLHSLNKERYVVGLLGYYIEPKGDNYWIIKDNVNTEVGHIVYEEKPYLEPSYHTIINKKGVYYDNERSINEANSKFFHYEFNDNNGYTVIRFNFDNPKKNIDMWFDMNDERQFASLTWNTTEEDYGFSIKTAISSMDPEDNIYYQKQSIEYVGNSDNGPKVTYNDKEFIGDITKLIDEGQVSIASLKQFDYVFDRLPFVKNLAEFIGTEDIKKSGLLPVYKVLMAMKDALKLMNRNNNDSKDGRKRFGGK